MGFVAVCTSSGGEYGGSGFGGGSEDDGDWTRVNGVVRRALVSMGSSTSGCKLARLSVYIELKTLSNS